MPVTDTPLRYPGGKSQLIPVVVEILKENDILYGEYAEPFAGGCGVPITLLLNSYVDHIYINDIDPAIYAFWYSVLNHADELCKLIKEAPVNIKEWHKQRILHFEGNLADVIQLGFSTLFLNRTNRSGILKAGVIGGLEQNGTYKIDCRFNREDLIKKIRRIALYKSRISLSRLDAVDFVSKIVPTTGQKTLVNLDPPYFAKGHELYTNFYKQNDHATLKDAVAKIEKYWMVTYDDTEEIRQLYAKFPLFIYGLNYSAHLKRVGTELMILDPKLRVPDTLKVSVTRLNQHQLTA